MYGEADVWRISCELAGQRTVAEVLELLSESGCHTALLTRFVAARPGELVAALELIARHGLLDGIAADAVSELPPRAISGPLRLSERGEAVAELLSGAAALHSTDRQIELSMCEVHWSAREAAFVARSAQYPGLSYTDEWSSLAAVDGLMDAIAHTRLAG